MHGPCSGLLFFFLVLFISICIVFIFDDKIDQCFQIKEPNHAYMAVHYTSDLLYRYFTILQSAWYILIYL